MSDPIAIETDKLVIGAAAATISQAIRPGEIVGLAGLDGHGQERFLEVLAGLRQPVSGEVFLDKSGSRTKITGFRTAVANGVAYLPRDRRATGIFPTQSVLDNFAISTVGRDAFFGLISPKKRRRR
jgi:ribose transport system ATP-binding protein